MREIKFRAWDKEEKEFITKTLLENGYCYDITFDKQMDIQQFTGLADKNGKEIYEGDIVKNDWTDINGKYIGHNWVIKFGKYDDSEIEWGSPAIGFYCENQEGEQESPINLPTNKRCGEFEVIGNIFSNPELLAGQPDDNLKPKHGAGSDCDIDMCPICEKIDNS